MGTILEEAPSVANFGERWPLAYFVFSNHCFGSFGGGEVRFGVEGSQFCGGAPSIVNSW